MIYVITYIVIAICFLVGGIIHQINDFEKNKWNNSNGPDFFDICLMSFLAGLLALIWPAILMLVVGLLPFAFIPGIVWGSLKLRKLYLARVEKLRKEKLQAEEMAKLSALDRWIATKNNLASNYR